MAFHVAKALHMSLPWQIIRQLDDDEAAATLWGSVAGVSLGLQSTLLPIRRKTMPQLDMTVVSPTTHREK